MLFSLIDEWFESPQRLFNCFIWLKCGQTLWGIVTHWPVVEAKKKKILSKEKMFTSVQGFPSEIIFTSNSSVQAGAGFIFYRTLLLIPDPYGEWELICLQTPTQRQMSGLKKQPAFLLVRSDGAPVAWLNAVTPTLTGLPHRVFLNLPQLTSHRMDKWIDCKKMAEEIQLQAWKWMSFPPRWLLAPPPPPSSSKSNWLE